MKYIYILGILLFLIGCNSEPTTEKININTKIELGEKLFFDPILSLDNSISCASCHQPEFAFADNKPFSVIYHLTNAFKKVNMFSFLFIIVSYSYKC